MRRDNLILFHPDDIVPPEVKNKEKEISTDEELQTLFPLSVAEFRKQWGKRFSFGVFNAILYSTGLRTSECRALSYEAID